MYETDPLIHVVYVGYPIGFCKTTQLKQIITNKLLYFLCLMFSTTYRLFQVSPKHCGYPVDSHILHTFCCRCESLQSNRNDKLLQNKRRHAADTVDAADGNGGSSGVSLPAPNKRWVCITYWFYLGLL